MAPQLVVPNPESKCPRGDRLQEEPSAKNAQGLFPPEACIFVGNLSTKVPTETLAEDLKAAFRPFGACHVKIKQDRKKGLPGAFVQFERVEDATGALTNEEPTFLHDRQLRIERAKGRRTACLGLRSFQPVTAQDVQTALKDRGPLEVYSIEQQQTGYQTWTDVAKVTFAFVDDCRDAIKHFQRDDKYYLNLLDMDGSPLLYDPVRGPSQGPGQNYPRSKPYYGPRAGNFQRNNNRQHRNGNGNFNNGGHFNHRNGFRGGFQKVHPPTMNNENILPLSQWNNASNPVLMNGVTMYADCRPPYHPPQFPLPPPPPNGWMGHPPPMFNGPPTPPDHFGPHMNNAPFVGGGQAQWTLPLPGFLPNPNGMFPESLSSVPGMNPDGLITPYGYMPFAEPWLGHGAFPPSPPHMNGHVFDQRQAPESMGRQTMKANDAPTEKTVDRAPDNDTVGGVPLNPKSPEKAPQLIRVYHPDDDDDEDDEVLSSGGDKASTVKAAADIADSESATEADSRSRSRSRSLSQSLRRSRSQSPSRSRSQSQSGSRSRSVSVTGIRSTDSALLWEQPEESKKTAVLGKDEPVEENSKTRSLSNSITSTTSSRTCASPAQKPVNAKSHTKNRPSIIEDHVRRHALARDLSEEALQDVIRSLESEGLIKDEQQGQEALVDGTDGCQSVPGTDPGGSQNGTVTRNVSVKSN